MGYNTQNNEISVKNQVWNGSSWINTDSTHYYYHFDVTTGVASHFNNSSVSVFPNPFSNETSILITSENNNFILKLTDVLGSELLNLNIKGKQTYIERGNLKSGIYFLQLFSESDTKLISTNKLIITD